MKDQNIKVETIRYGQPAPYKDSYYEYILTFTDNNSFPAETQVKLFAKAVRPCRRFADEVLKEEGEETRYFTPHLIKIEPIGTIREAPKRSNKWRIVIRENYTG